VPTLAGVTAVSPSEPSEQPEEQSAPRGFVVREWHLEPYDGDQAPRHVHHGGDEAFCVLEGEIDVEDSGVRHRLRAGEWHTVRAGSAHTFATVDDVGARVLAVMTPEIDALVSALHADPEGDGARPDPASVWARHHSELLP